LKSVIVPSVQSPPSMLKLHDFCNRALNVLFRQSEQFLVRKLWEQGWTIDQDTDRATKTFWSAVFGAVLISQAGFPGGPSSVDVAATLSIRSTEER
ncbi:TetR/AcrR family transcriptional regulator C-terminal domain-containing protein, partial [Corynebacterium xerosis]|uniref:TetR/AcrR family transcriptional regulator C-terminal domain-containing protein n=1 Tax=Corynebacterium xerosis TaxID=1725 RepID=UPI0023F887C8